MNATLITIGDEILAGNTIDTNSNFIANALKEIGINVGKIVTISDDIETIKNALEEGFTNSDLIITTGGLGPTKDDKTKKAFSEYFETNLITGQKTLDHLEAFFKRRNREELFALNQEQGKIFEGGHVFLNDNGTAPGLLAQKDGKFAICLPGVPYEVKPLIKDKIIPYLKEKADQNYIITKVISIINFPESQLSDKIEPWELSLPENVSLAYLPMANRVKLKLTAKGNNKSELESILEEQTTLLRPYLDERIISEDGEKIEMIVGDYLTLNDLTISCAESCTGGELAHLLTSVSGSSNYFKGGIVAYDESVKIAQLNVKKETIEKNTVVSEPVAKEMSLGAQQMFKTDIAISTTGVAGPTTDHYNNKIGLAYYSIRIHDQEKTYMLDVPFLDRKDFMNYVSQKALQDLLALLIQIKKLETIQK